MTQEFALKLLKTGKNVFLTGSAGTGKTYVLNQYIRYLRARKMNVAITASTGIAATHMNGQTIHSWAGIGVKDKLTDADFKRLKSRKYFTKRIDTTKVLLIDEISMLHQRQFQLVDEVLRYFKDPFLPFGGLQVVVSGDFFQLPPIERANVPSREIFCFMSEAWVNANFTVCYLTEQFRQENNELQNILNEIRCQTISEQTINTLQRKVVDARQDVVETYPHLYTHNANVDRFNAEKLLALRGQTKIYIAERKGNAKLVDQLTRNVSAQLEFKVKKGAEVMFIRNNPEEGYVNGTLGRVEGFNEDGFPIVVTRNHEEIDATPVAWTIENEKGHVIAEFQQVPLRLAWAITVHKSQGMTLDEACVNLEQAFEVGQGYVALSRLRDLDGLTLLGINDKALELDRLALKADARFQVLSKQHEFVAEHEDVEEEARRFLKKNGGLLSRKQINKTKDKLKQKKKKVATHLITKQLLEEGLSINEIAAKRGLVISTILGHLAKVKKQNPDYDFSSVVIDEQLVLTVKQAREKVDDEVKNSYKEIYSLLNGKVSYEDIRLALLVL